MVLFFEAVRNWCVLFGRRLQALVAVAPIFRPGGILFNFASGFGFLPFSSAFLLALACGKLARARFFFCFGILAQRARLLLRRGGRNELGYRRRNQRDGERGRKKNFGHDVIS